MKRGFGFWGLVLGDAWVKFNQDDGWAIASHVALSGLFALFPFLIFATSIAGFLDMGTFTENAVNVIFGYWPEAASEVIAREVRNILTVPRSDFLTIGGLLTLYFASNGVEALRIALNRAYRTREKRSFILQRLQSFALVFIAIFSLIALTLLLVLMPLVWSIAARYLPNMVDWREVVGIIRVMLAFLILLTALVIMHKYLPAGKRPLSATVPGIILTLSLWIIASVAFGAYLEQFADYVSTYAGLAGAMIGLLFLYMLGLIFILGGYVNASYARFAPIY